MKNMCKLPLATILCSCVFFLNAQTVDTAGLQKNENGTISFAHVSNTPMVDALSFLKNTLQTTDKDSFALIKKSTDELGITHQRYQQYYKGIKVENAEYLLHGKDGNIETMNGDFQVVDIASVLPLLSEQQALSYALKYVNASKYKWQDSASENFLKQHSKNLNASYYPIGELVIERDYLKGGTNLLLSWKFSISSLNPNNAQLIYIDANTGEIINTTSKMLDSNTPLTAQTKYSSTQTITGDSYTSGYRLREIRNGVNVETLNLNGSDIYSNATDFSNNNTNWIAGSWSSITQDQQALDAHYGAEKVLDFWRTVFNRNSLDDNGINILNYVHNPIGPNAYWDEDADVMNYGDGDGTTTSPFTSLDICAHEMGHGINEFTANLVAGTQESGALNEGLSDIWAACIEYWAAPTKQTWLFGEEVFKTSTYDCIRNMQNPKDSHTWESQSPHPDTYQGTYWDANGEPHKNSTVLSHWFYLLSQGGSGTNDIGNGFNVYGIGISDAQKIVWETESAYLSPSAGYSAARTLSIQAATNLFGANSCQVKAVTDVWYAVGIGSAFSGSFGTQSISGPNNFCTTSTAYSVNNLPTGATVTWSATPSGIVTINSPNSTQTTLTRIQAGYATLFANVNLCGSPVIVQKNNIAVSDGTPYFTGTYNSPTNPAQSIVPSPTHTLDPIINPSCVALGTNMSVPVGATIAWSANQIDPGVTWGQGGNNIWVNFSDTGEIAAFLAFGTDACGSYQLRYVFKCTTMITCGIQPQFVYQPETESRSVTLLPNPASNTVTITSANTEATTITGSKNSTASKTTAPDTKTIIKQVRIFDVSGRLMKQMNYSTPQQQVNIDVAALQTGIYFVIISDGKNLSYKKMFIQR